jgi:hypothetical protein
MFEQTWSPLVSFIATEDGAERIGEPLDTSLDGKLILFQKKESAVYLI